MSLYFRFIRLFCNIQYGVTCLHMIDNKTIVQTHTIQIKYEYCPDRNNAVRKKLFSMNGFESAHRIGDGTTSNTQKPPFSRMSRHDFEMIASHLRRISAPILALFIFQPFFFIYYTHLWTLYFFSIVFLK